MKKKHYVTKSTKSGYVRVGTDNQLLQEKDYVAICSKRFKEIAGFLPKKDEMIPIYIKIIQGKQ